MSGAEQRRRMDAIYASQRHIYDLTRKYYLFGRDTMLRRLDPPRGGSVLEIGCGTARNLIALARVRPDIRCHGVDISAAMLKTAHGRIASAGLAERVAVAEGDALDFDPVLLFGQGRFDRVFISYALSMIPGWEAALDHAGGLLAPGGELHIVDFGQQERLPGMWRSLLFAWLDRFHVTPRARLADALDRVARDHGLRGEMQVLMRGYAWRATLGRPGEDRGAGIDAHPRHVPEGAALSLQWRRRREARARSCFVRRTALRAR